MRDKIIQLREMTGNNIHTCKEALRITDDDLLVAKHYLILINQPINRRTRVNGEMVPWSSQDYLDNAKLRAERERNIEK